MDGSIERRLLATVLKARRNYVVLGNFLGAEDFSDIGRIIYDQVGKYYEADEAATMVDVPTFVSRLKRRYRTQADILSEVAESCASLIDSISEVNLLEEIFAQKVSDRKSVV